MSDSTLHAVESGLDVLEAEGFRRLQGKRVAILANQASVNKHIDHIVPLAIKHGVNLVKLFAPEHGFFGTLQDMEHVSEGIDPKLKIPVISLYGDHKASLSLNVRHLKDVDVLLCDLQDVGSRYYTFHCTIAWAMAACRESNTLLMVIDRPNPINACQIEGNIVKKPHFSFVGAYPLPNRHGFTMGELVRYVKDALAVDLDIEVVWMKNYRRSLYMDEMRLPFVSPSPNMPTVNAAVVYPGMCLVEGTNLSEGRGTCTPFELVGAPYITDAEKFAHDIEALGVLGVKLRACEFKPKFQKHANQNCKGVFIHVIDRNKFSPVRFALKLISVAMTFEGFDWRREPYEYETDRLAIDLLFGDARIREMLESKIPICEAEQLFSHDEKHFNSVRKEYLNYVD